MRHQGPSLGSLGESGVLSGVFTAFSQLPDSGVLVGPGDDTAYLSVRSGSVLATTDTMVRGRDWLDEWSTPQDVGIKAVTQNLADLASMGGVGTGLLVTLIADAQTPATWVEGLTEGIAEGAARAGVPVIGGDLSSAPEGMLAVSITALGELGPGVLTPVLRSGARPGDVLAVSGRLGRSGAGLVLLEEGIAGGEGRVATVDRDRVAELVQFHRRPLTDLPQGPLAARTGATAMIDVSDGLVRDGDRIARDSGVRLTLDEESVVGLAAELEPAVGAERARQAVLAGGEEHELLATFPATAQLPPGWIVLGRVEAVAGEAVNREAVNGEAVNGGAGEGPGVWLRGVRLDPSAGGWDHFGG